eukprot:403374986
MTITQSTSKIERNNIEELQNQIRIQYLEDDNDTHDKQNFIHDFKIPPYPNEENNNKQSPLVNNDQIQNQISQQNMKYFSYFLLTILLLVILNKLKAKYFEWSTGNFTQRVRDVQFADRISGQEFERQKRNYTQEQVNRLIKSQEYQERSRLIKRLHQY